MPQQDVINYTARQMHAFREEASMIGGLLRIVLVVVVVAAVAAFFLGYRFGDRDRTAEPSSVIGTTGKPIDVDRARAAGANVAEKVAEGANQVERVASDAALTTKIKSKMALDDSIDALEIDVDTANGVVTLNGSVDSPEHRERAVRLARETEGVVSVVDRLVIQ
jgi:BON domain